MPANATLLDSLPTGTKILIALVVVALATRKFRKEMNAEKDEEMAGMMETGGGFLVEEFEALGLNDDDKNVETELVEELESLRLGNGKKVRFVDQEKEKKD